MKRVFPFIIEKEETIESFLFNIGFPKTVIFYLRKHNENIILNLTETRSDTLMKPKDFLQIIVEDKNNPDILPKAMLLNIIYEDEDIIVINKPANLPIHPSKRDFENSLANGLAYYYNNDFAYHCITRLDKDTSGLVLIAKNQVSAAILSTSMANGNIQKRYRAIVEGQIDEYGIVNAPITKKNQDTIERVVDMVNGQNAITHYHRLSYNKEKNISLVDIWTETGRTHQIRVHMQYIGHPLVGDKLYNPSNNQLTRQALHSYSINIIHPITKKPMGFHCPLADDMTNLLD